MVPVTKSNDKEILKEENKMEKNQKINCTVYSCQFHEDKTNMCRLDEITVKAYQNCNSGETDESVCGSYKCCE